MLDFNTSPRATRNLRIGFISKNTFSQAFFERFPTFTCFNFISLANIFDVISPLFECFKYLYSLLLYHLTVSDGGGLGHVGINHVLVRCVEQWDPQQILNWCQDPQSYCHIFTFQFTHYNENQSEKIKQLRNLIGFIFSSPSSCILTAALQQHKYWANLHRYWALPLKITGFPFTTFQKKLMRHSQIVRL